MSDDSEEIALVQRLQKAATRFADDMRRQGIHIGMGADPRCVTCGESFPCAASADSLHS